MPSAIFGTLFSLAYAENLQQLQQRCAQAAIATEPAQVMGIRFDAAVPEQHSDLGEPLVPNNTVNNILYTHCHVRLLSNGRMLTKHFEIGANNHLIEIIRVSKTKKSHDHKAFKQQHKPQEIEPLLRSEAIVVQDNIARQTTPEIETVTEIQSFYFADPSNKQP